MINYFFVLITNVIFDKHLKTFIKKKNFKFEKV